MKCISETRLVIAIRLKSKYFTKPQEDDISVNLVCNRISIQMQPMIQAACQNDKHQSPVAKELLFCNLQLDGIKMDV